MEPDVPTWPTQSGLGLAIPVGFRHERDTKLPGPLRTAMPASPWECWQRTAGRIREGVEAIRPELEQRIRVILCRG